MECSGVIGSRTRNLSSLSIIDMYHRSPAALVPSQDGINNPDQGSAITIQLLVPWLDR